MITLNLKTGNTANSKQKGGHKNNVFGPNQSMEVTITLNNDGNHKQNAGNKNAKTATNSNAGNCKQPKPANSSKTNFTHQNSNRNQAFKASNTGVSKTAMGGNIGTKETAKNPANRANQIKNVANQKTECVAFAKIKTGNSSQNVALAGIKVNIPNAPNQKVKGAAIAKVKTMNAGHRSK